MRHSCVVTRLHRDVRITLPLQQQRRGICLPCRALFLERHTVDGGEWETAPHTDDEPWEDQSWEEPGEAEVLDDDWTDEVPPEDLELEDQFGSLEAAEAYAVTEFKNASSDMRNATRTFMEAKDLVSRVKHARGYFPVVGVCAFDGFQTVTPRGSRQTGAGKGTSTDMNSQTGKGRGRGLAKGKHPRDSRRPSPAKFQSDINRSCEGRTGTWNSHSTRSVFTLSPHGTSGPGLSRSRDA